MSEKEHLCETMCVCVVCVCVCVRACICARLCVRVRVRVSVLIGRCAVDFWLSFYSSNRSESIFPLAFHLRFWSLHSISTRLHSDRLAHTYMHTFVVAYVKAYIRVQTLVYMHIYT